MQTYKTLIIGSGIVGASIAHHLSKKQKDIIVVDQGFPSRGTSGATQAWIWVHTKQPSFYGELSMLSGELYQILKKELSMDFELVRTGGLSLIYEEKKLEEAKNLIDRQKAYGIDISLLSKEEVIKKESSVTKDIVGATYSPLDGHVNPFRLNWAFIEEAKRNAVEFSFQNKVYNIQRHNGHFEVKTAKETFRAEQVVIAGGPWSKAIGNLFGVEIPIKLVKGQILVTEPISPVLKHIVSGIRQTDNGELLVGYSREEGDVDRSTSYDVIGETARYLKKVIPSLHNINIVRSFAGIRSVPMDGLPILGEVPSIENLYVAASHSGITLAPIIGNLMAEVINHEAPTLSMEPYSIKRFEQKILSN